MPVLRGRGVAEAEPAAMHQLRLVPHSCIMPCISIIQHDASFEDELFRVFKRALVALVAMVAASTCGLG
jgi:hypothetical protein